MDPKFKTGKYACANCPLGCGADYSVSEGDWPLKETFRPEYETLAAFGCLCLNDSDEAVIKCNDLCNRCGLDTISAGATIAWAMECFENGIITKEDTDGIELTWGNAQAMVDMTEAMCQNKGFGKILALGSQGAADALGKGHEYLQVVNGIELPMHDPRFAPGYGRTYYTDPAPARHVKGGLGMIQVGQAAEVKYNEEDTGVGDYRSTTFNEIVNAAGLCLFGLNVGIAGKLKGLMAAVTGRELSTPDLTNTGTRIFSMRHVFNLREGQDLSSLVMPPRSVGDPPQQEGPLEDITIDYKKLHQNFCQAIQWDETSLIPSRESLEALGGLEDVIEDLWK